MQQHCQQTQVAQRSVREQRGWNGPVALLFQEEPYRAARHWAPEVRNALVERAQRIEHCLLVVAKELRQHQGQVAAILV